MLPGEEVWVEASIGFKGFLLQDSGNLSAKCSVPKSEKHFIAVHLKLYPRERGGWGEECAWSEGVGRCLYGGINPPLTTHDEPDDVHDGEDVDAGDSVNVKDTKWQCGWPA